MPERKTTEQYRWSFFVKRFKGLQKCRLNPCLIVESLKLSLWKNLLIEKQKNYNFLKKKISFPSYLHIFLDDVLYMSFNVLPAIRNLNNSWMCTQSLACDIHWVLWQLSDFHWFGWVFFCNAYYLFWFRLHIFMLPKRKNNVNIDNKFSSLLSRVHRLFYFYGY